MDSDDSLIRKYLNGDSLAFSVLLERYVKSVYNFVFWFTHDAEMSEDIVQETFVKIWKNLDKFQEDKLFKTWLFSVARNTSIDWLRKKKNVPFSDFDDESGENSFEENIADEDPGLIEKMMEDERREELIDVVNKLEYKYKDIILLHIFENLSFKEISEILKRPVNTVKSQYRRGSAVLKKYLSS